MKKIFLLFVIVLSILITSCKRNNKIPNPITPVNTATNPIERSEFTELNNVGRYPLADTIVSIGDYVFYNGIVKNETNSKLSSSGLYMKNMYDISLSLLIYDDFQGQINQYRGRLFFKSKEKDQLIELDPQTRESKIVIDSYVDQAFIIGDTLFYNTITGIHAIDLTDYKDTILIDNIKFPKAMYFLEKNGDLFFYYYKKDPSEQIPCTWSKEHGLKELDFSVYPKMLWPEYFFEDGRILGHSEDGIRLYSEDGKYSELVIPVKEFNIRSIFVVGDYIYYNKMDKDGTKSYRYSIKDKSQRLYNSMKQPILYTEGNIILEGYAVQPEIIYSVDSESGIRNIFDTESLQLVNNYGDIE